MFLLLWFFRLTEWFGHVNHHVLHSMKALVINFTVKIDRVPGLIQRDKFVLDLSLLLFQLVQLFRFVSLNVLFVLNDFNVDSRKM